jgi:hypothetical protein
MRQAMTIIGAVLGEAFLSEDEPASWLGNNGHGATVKIDMSQSGRVATYARDIPVRFYP